MYPPSLRMRFIQFPLLARPCAGLFFCARPWFSWSPSLHISRVGPTLRRASQCENLVTPNPFCTGLLSRACELDSGSLNARFSALFSRNVSTFLRSVERKITRPSTHSRTHPREICRLGMARRRRGLPNQHHPKIIHVGARRPRDNQIVGGLKKAIGIVRRQRDVRVYTGRQGARQRIGEE